MRAFLDLWRNGSGHDESRSILGSWSMSYHSIAWDLQRRSSSVVNLIGLFVLITTVAGCTDRSRVGASAGGATLSEANLLGNPGFEDDVEAFSPWLRHVHADGDSFTFAADGAVYREGSKSMRIERVTPEPYASIVQSFRKRELSSKRYRLSAWVSGADLSSPVYLHANFFSYGSPSGETGGPDAGLQGTFDWSRLELDISLPERFDRAEFGLSTTGDGTVWIDAVELVPIP
jgi:hypothetical protein